MGLFKFHNYYTFDNLRNIFLYLFYLKLFQQKNTKEVQYPVISII